MNTLFGLKSSMTTRFDSTGKRLTVTSVTVEPHTVIEKKTSDKAGYDAVVVGIGSRKRAAQALTKKLPAGVKIPRYIREVKSTQTPDAGASVAIADVLTVGDIVSVSGITKGKGFTGVVKRYNFRGGPKTHGQSDRHRARGSLGSGTTPGRVFPGLRMAGRSGGAIATVRNLVVLHINNQTGEVLLSGPIPGHRNTLVSITKTGEKKNFPGIDLFESDKAQEVVNAPGEEVSEVVSEEPAVPTAEEKVSE